MNWWIILIIIVILGFIVGNILLLKHSANFKFEKPDIEEKNGTNNDEQNP